MLKSETVRELAREAGFDAVGFTRARRAPHADGFLDWLAEGLHAGMAWLARDPHTRCDPRVTLPGAATVIALAMNYFCDDPPDPPDSAARGVIARYACGRDYHNLIRKRLRVLDRALAGMGGTQRCFVDSGPLLERDFAVAAGIAWHGKSTLALHPRLGTWFFLAAVTTTLEFEPDPPMPDRCGSCVRCIDACPTRAITAPRKVDSGLCLSYWTIEHRGPFPEWVREKLGPRIFGCDDCLDACPWNRFARESREAGFRARAASRLPIRDYLMLDEAEFRALFEGSPIRRAGHEGFLRNCCTALAHCGDTGDLPALDRVASGGLPMPAQHAAWAAAKIRAR